MKIDYDKAIVNRGNLVRLENVIKKINSDKSISIGFIGGSITQGCHASTYENSYSYLVYKWFRNKNQNVRYINAGIGGTTSYYGVARVDSDLLDERPDLVFVEFSVNDFNTDFYKETYEGLIRRILYHDCKPAVVLIHNIKYDDGFSSYENHIKIGEYYDIPAVSMHTDLYEQVKNGILDAKDITTDYLHPNSKGHKIIADTIIHFLESIEEENVVECGIQKKQPLTSNRYENTVIYNSLNINPTLKGFKKDSRPKEYYTDIFKGGWFANNKNDEIVFKIKASEIAIQYRETISRPAPVALVTVDEGEEGIVLDGNFNEDWGDNLKIKNVLTHGSNIEHTIKIRVINADNVISDFYLVAVIASEKTSKNSCI